MREQRQAFAQPRLGSRRVRIACAMLAILATGCAKHRVATPTAPAVTARILGAGSVITEHEDDRLAAPATAEGSIGQVPTYWTPDFISSPDQVRARLGLSIGIEVRVEGPEFLTEVPLRTRVAHPPIVDPDTGRATTVDEWDNPMNARFPRFTGWRFEHPWELVPGTWRIDLLHQGRPIASQTFQVAIAASATDG